MNRSGKISLPMFALLLAAAVAYLSDPVLSDPQRGPEPTQTPTAVEAPTDTSATSTPPVSSTSTPQPRQQRPPSTLLPQSR